jgi:hypothetical protein
MAYSSKKVNLFAIGFFIVANVFMATPAFAALSPRVRSEFVTASINSCIAESAKNHELRRILTTKSIHYFCRCLSNNTANTLDDADVWLAALTKDSSSGIEVAKGFVPMCFRKTVIAQVLYEQGIPYKD